VNREQLKKPPKPRDITEFGIVSVVNEECIKKQFPRDVTECEIVKIVDE
jgi:hypothetical protein